MLGIYISVYQEPPQKNLMFSVSLLVMKLPESTIFDVVSMVSRQDVTSLTVPNSLRLTLSIADRLAMGTECCQNDLSQLD